MITSLGKTFSDLADGQAIHPRVIAGLALMVIEREASLSYFKANKGYLSVKKQWLAEAFVKFDISPADYADVKKQAAIKEEK